MSAEPTFIARQPILDQDGRVYGYELLFRRNSTSESCDTVAEIASATVITNAVVGIGLDTLTQGRRAFVNVGRRMLLEGISEVLPAHRVVIELTEDIEADADTIDACHRLRRAGYTLALDDFVLNERTEALVPLADFIKIDFLGTSDP
ncbi:MAG TPA: hypothetical protein VFO19_06630, partial [Vicinamibacterales bacterium]|nr:hypothetical protein [Vicinamibacterales bacterium]